MQKNNELLLKQMREERETSQSVYTEFISDRKYYKTHAFCFYAREEGKYYNPRVEKKFKKIISYEVRNKREVLKLLRRITSTDLYSNVCVMFFVDRKYDSNMNVYNEELFETPCYSIENLYVQRECLEKILRSKFRLNETDNDFAKCMQDFEQRVTEFNNQILEFNALVYLRKEKDVDYLFDSVKTSHMIKVNVAKVSKTAEYDNIINRIKEKLKIDNKEIEEAKNELINNGNFMQNFRGENQLDFFVEFVNDFKCKNVHINITMSRLSELSQYALTPSSLESFLEKRKEKFPTLSANLI